jgi:hypothetical protein
MNSQRQILRPAVNALKQYLRLFVPGKECDTNAFSQCLINHYQQEDQNPAGEEFFWNDCSSKSNCTAKWSNLSIERKEKVEERFGRRGQRM